MIREHSNEADTMHSPRFVACTHTVNVNKTPFYGHFWFVQSIDNLLLVLCRNGFMKNYYSQLFICQMLEMPYGCRETRHHSRLSQRASAFHASWDDVERLAGRKI